MKLVIVANQKVKASVALPDVSEQDMRSLQLSSDIDVTPMIRNRNTVQEVLIKV